MTNKIATEQYLINLAGGGTNTPTKCATRDRVEFFGLETNDNYANNQLVKEEDIQLSTFQYDFNIHVSITNSGLTSKSYDFVADVYIDGVPNGFITIPRSGTLDYQGQLSLTETSTLIYQLIQLMSLNYCSLDISVHTG